MPIQDIFEQFEKLEHITGLFDRKDLIKEIHTTDKDVAGKIFKYVKNPDFVFGISNARISYEAANINTTTFDEFEMLVKSLNDKVLTGNKAKDAVNNFLARADAIHSKWYERIILKDLRTGVGATILEEFWPDIRKTDRTFVKATLAQDMEKKYYERAKHWILQPKIDGLRLFICYKANPNTEPTVEFITRANKSYGHLVPLFIADLDKLYAAYGKDFMLDVECFSEDWNKSMSAVLTKKKEVAPEILKKLKLYVLDFLPYVEFEKQTCSEIQIKRLEIIEHIVNKTVMTYVTILPEQIYLKDEPFEKVHEYIDKYAENGHEGIVLRDANALYPYKRAWHWLKGKKFYEIDVLVTGVDKDGKREGEIRCFETVCPDGRTLRPGSGLSQDERKEYFKYPERIIGKTIEIQFQKPSETSLVIPTIRNDAGKIRIRDDK